MPNGTVLITGGTGLFGQAVALDLLRHGWGVIVTTRAERNADALRQSALQLADQLHVIEFDYETDPNLDSLMTALHGHSVSHVVNNARSISNLRVDTDGTTQPAAFEAEFRIDVLLPYQLSIGLAHDESHPLKVILNIGSQYGLVAPNPALYGGTLKTSPIQYGVSKAALHHLTRELAARLSDRHIRVNCIAFGGVRGRTADDFAQRYAGMSPLGRMLEIEEVIGPVRFLLSEHSSAINGHVLVADGGWSIW